MSDIYLKIAGFNISIILKDIIPKSIKINVENRIINPYKNFVLKNSPNQIDFFIEFARGDITQALILEKNQKYYINIFDFKSKNKIVVSYLISLYQFQLILRIIIQKLLEIHGGFILHASAIYKGGKSNIFVGPSGSGKSTIINLLKNNFQVIGDDSVIIRNIQSKIASEIQLYQSPFHEKEEWVKRYPDKFEIDKILFLVKSNNTKIIKIHDNKNIFRLMQNQVFITNEKNIVLIQKYIKKFIEGYNNFYFFYFKKDKEVILKTI